MPNLLAIKKYFVYTCVKKWDVVGDSGAPECYRRSAVKGEAEHMFLGQYRHAIDNKGRLTVPARYRELLVADGAFVMQGFDCNLMVLTQPAFERVSRKVNQMSMTEPNARMLKRLIFSTAERVEVDKAGRILIPEFLRNGIELDAEAVLVGVGDYFEIWNPKDWEGQNTQLHDLEANSQRFSIWDLSTE